MSEFEIPFNIQEEIMKRLPVKSLVQFRSVSKTWKSLIDSPEFISDHCLHRHTQQQHLIVSYYDLTCVCFVDNYTLPQQRSLPTLPPSIKQMSHARVVGSSHGLLCLYGSHRGLQTMVAVIWNPSIRKAIDVPVVFTNQLVRKNQLQECVGFGVCPVTKDPKILAIAQTWDFGNIEASFCCKAMVYTLSSGKWTSLSTNLPTKPLRESFYVVTDRFIYWSSMLMNRNIIISFDVTDESFEAIDLPDSLAHHDQKDLHSSRLKNSLIILLFRGSFYSVWRMEHSSVERSFTQLFIIKAPHRIVGFRKSGVPIMQLKNEDDDDSSKLVVYEPNSEHNIILEESGPWCWFHVHNYKETLLLFGQSGCKSY